MDVSFTNVLEGARQYFQGLPAPSVNVGSGSTENDGYSSQTKAATPATNDTRYDENKPDNRDTSHLNDSYWNSSGSNELRTIEPYPPQPTRVEVPDTRPDDRPEHNGSPGISLTEMQPPSRPQSQRQDQQSVNSAINPSPVIHQLEPPLKPHSPPVYQQLNNVPRSSAYRASDMLNSHSTYQPNERPTSSPITQRTQYYPRYHHPDITKSAPAPFSQNSVYQTPQPTTSTSSSTTPHQPVATRTNPTEQDNSVVLSHRSASQQDQQQQSQTTNVYPAYPTINNHEQSSRPSGFSNSQTQMQQLRHPADGTSAHSVPALSTNPCSPRHTGQSYIHSPHNHPGHITSPHLPVASVQPPSSLSSIHAVPQQYQQQPLPTSQQQIHVPQQHPIQQHSNRINTSSHEMTSYSSRVTNPYPSSHSSHNSAMSQQQMPPPPSSSSNYHPAASPHELNHHASPSPQRQSPHVPIVHNPHAISPHHTPSPHHNPSPHTTANFQPHSPTYPPPPPPLPTRPSAHPYGITAVAQHHRPTASYPNVYPPHQSSYHSYQKSMQSGVYPQTSRSQYGQSPVPSSIPPPLPPSSASNHINGISYLPPPTKSTVHNGVDPKRNSFSTNQINSYNSYRMPSAVQRNSNTHNLPITAVSSYHSNKSSREAVGKTQTQARHRTPSIIVPGSSSGVSQPTMSIHTSRAPDYTLNTSYGNHSAATTTSGYSAQMTHRNYATTIAPSHHSNSSSTTTVTSINLDSRPAAPTAVTVHARTSSDSNNRPYPSSQPPNNNHNPGYKDYLYSNSSSVINQPSQPVSRVSPTPPQVNGLPLRKRESPLDLSVKTIKTSADSTARDDLDNGSTDKQVSSSVGNSRTSRSMPPPPVQPADVPYVTYDSRNNVRNPMAANLRPSTPQMPVCAPKVDFLPNFNSTPVRHHPSSQPNHVENPLRRSSSQKLYVPSAPSLQNSNSMPLPHMSTFKKSSLPNTPLYNNKMSYPSANEMPNIRPTLRYSSMDPARPTLPVHEYPSDINKYYLDSRGKHQMLQARDRVALKRPGEPIYMAGGSEQNKQPRVDNWKLAIDKEIQQKLEAARVLHEQQKRHEMTLPRAMPNGTLVSPSTFNQRDNPCSPTPKRHPAFCDKRTYPESKVPLDSGSYIHSNEKSTGASLSTGQPTTSQAAYPPGYRQPPRSPYSTQPLDQPSNTGADKRVLSLLRNSLENKQQREEQLNSQQPILVNHSQQSFQNKVVAPVEPKTNIGRHNLSPFTAASLLERNSNTPPHYKFHVPRAVDSITQETPRSLYASRVNSSATLPAGKEALLAPRELENQIHRDKDDSLAAILAAKIRTKAELKQVGTGQFTSKPVSLSSQDISATPSDFERVASTSTPQSIASSVGSPPKLTCEKAASLPPRRRLFSRCEEENMPVAATTPTVTPIPVAASAIAARTSGFRSSSETSVFDFRDTDSEGEMPVLERQTLEEMRRDRKQLSKVQPPVPLDDAMCIGMTSCNDLVKIELKENDNITEVDPLWSATCDKFMEQLRSGDAVKKRGRKRKIGDNSKADDVDDESKDSNSRLSDIIIKPEEIKKESNDDEVVNKNVKELVDETKTSKSNSGDATKSKTDVSPKQEVEEEEEIAIEKHKKKAEAEEEEEEDEEVEDDERNGNNSDDESEEFNLVKRVNKKKGKKDDSDIDEEIIIKKRQIRRGSRIKLESSSASESSSGDDSDGSVEVPRGSSVAHRLRARKRSGIGGTGENEGMKLRSRDTGAKTKEEKTPKTPVKNSSSQKPKPKPLFGDGSDFRPGWEEEVYVYKKSLRMPPRLINVSKPARFHRLSTSLPDLDPDSPALSVSMDSSDVCLRKRTADSDLDSNYSFSIVGSGLGSKIDDEEATSSTTVSCPPKTTSSRQTRSESNSIVDLLARKVGGNNKKDGKKKVKDKFEKNGNKVLPKGSNEPELLPTPSFTPLLKNDSPSKVKGRIPVKNNKLSKLINPPDSSYLLGYFRKETVNNFRDTFKNNYALPNEFSTYILKSRTRTETRVMKKEATIREVFGEDRPASAPPMQNHAGDTSQDDDSQTETKDIILGRTKTLKQKVVSRLRNVGILRSNKAILNSKRHLLTAQRRKYLLKSLTEKKLHNLKKEPEVEEEEVAQDEEDDEQDEDETEVNEPNVDNNNDGTEISSKKKLKLRTGRRKFRSGFDYIRKKKKPLKKDETTLKERKKTITRPNAECVADIQSEIRTWVIKKGVGETILHRAARLGYADVTAYCLEKLNSPPSPKDNAGYTPLHEACAKGHLEIAKLLLAYGANVSESANGGIRPLHEAAENGATELVRLLLSYGADPLLATYAGQTPLLLAVDTDAHLLLKQHLDDVQGRSSVSWNFGGPSSIFDPKKNGFNPLDDVPLPDSPEPELDEIEIEVSETNLPVLYHICFSDEKWVLTQDLMAALKIKSRDALLKQLNPKAPMGPPVVAHRGIYKEFTLEEFFEFVECCHLANAGQKINVRGSKISFIQYNDKVRSLLNIEKVVINLR